MRLLPGCPSSLLPGLRLAGHRTTTAYNAIWQPASAWRVNNMLQDYLWLDNAPPLHVDIHLRLTVHWQIGADKFWLQYTVGFADCRASIDAPVCLACVVCVLWSTSSSDHLHCDLQDYCQNRVDHGAEWSWSSLRPDPVAGFSRGR